MSFEIRTWKVSYYQNDGRKWITGQLTCSPSNLSFHKDDSAKSTEQKTQKQSGSTTAGFEITQSFRLLIDYINIKQVKKATSMLIYSAVTVETQNGVVHWFSSLPDRYSVYNVIHHFVHHCLVNDSRHCSKQHHVEASSQTRLGQQLLRSAEESERTLAQAAGELHHQGRQLARSSIQLQEIHEDLDVADRLLTGLNTYLGQWKLPQEYTAVEPVHVNKDEVSSNYDLEVLSTVMSRDHFHSQQLSILRMTSRGLILLDTRQRPLHSFRWMELSRAFVVSPWEVVLTRHVAGSADVSVSVISASLFPVLKLLQKQVPNLVDFQKVPESVKNMPDLSGEGPKYVAKTRDHSNETTPACLPFRPKDINAEEAGITELQVQGKQQQETVSEAELLALQSKLGGLKMMASAVGEEVTLQNQVLDDMIESVDVADARIQDATKRTKKLM